MDTKRPPTFSVDGLGNDMDFQALRRKWSAPADCFRCKVRWDSCYGSARGAAPCTEQGDAKQPGQSTVRTACLAERTYSRQESIEVRPCYQGILLLSYAFRKKPCWNAPGNWNFFSSPPKEITIIPFCMLTTVPVPNALCTTLTPGAMSETSTGTGSGFFGATGAGGNRQDDR